MIFVLVNIVVFQIKRCSILKPNQTPNDEMHILLNPKLVIFIRNKVYENSHK